MTAKLKLDTLELNNNMLWTDQWAFAAADKTVTRTLLGNVVVFSAALQRGQPITLEATDEQGWLTKTQVQALYNLAQTPGATYPLVIPYHGDELIADPEFDTGTGWTVNAPWTLNGGRALIDGSQLSPVQLVAAGIIIPDGSRYSIRYKLSSITAGNVQASIPGGVGQLRATYGVVEDIITADPSGPAGDFALVADVNFAGQIDWVSVRKVTDQTYSVQFRHNDAPAFNAVPLIPRLIARPDDQFTATIKLMTV